MRSNDLSIEVEQVTKRYRRAAVLQSITFSVGKGERLGLVGRNAVGKSTLFGILGGFVRPSSGSARILGEPCGSSALRRRVGIAPETVTLPPNDKVHLLLERLAEWQLISRPRDEVRRVLDVMDLTTWAHARAGSLSKGVARRVILAQAILGAPEVLLLDEPTSGLDSSARGQFGEELHALSGSGVSVLVSSHDDEWIARTCSRSIPLLGEVPVTVSRPTSSAVGQAPPGEPPELESLIEPLETRPT